MTQLFLANEKVGEFLSGFSKIMKVFAPINTVSPSFEEWSENKQYFPGKTAYSAKNIFFPQYDELLSIGFNKSQQNDTQININSKNDEFSPRLVFGIRPCDLKAIEVFEKVMSTGAYRHPGFQKRLEQSVLAVILCPDKHSGCFCDIMGLNRMRVGKLADLALTPTSKGYIVHPSSKKGTEILNSANLPEPSEKWQDDIDKSSANSPVNDHGHNGGMTSRLSDALFNNEEFWSEKTAACLGCGICTYVCPTCHCFDITDYNFGSFNVKRLQSWDSCMFYNFTNEASGHNPRKLRWQRYRNRINHKFNYLPNKKDISGCTGCGRCVALCPASVDFRGILSSATEKQNE